MKKINSTLIFLLLGIAISSLFLSSCKKDITENIDLRFKPTLFEYTGLIRVYDAADSTVPNNLDIVFAAGQENLLYSIFGDKELKFSPSGTLEFGLHPAVKPTGTEPVVIRFDLTAPGYISQPFSVEFYEGRPAVRKEFSLMNKSNLPDGISYTEFSGTIQNGILQEDIVINLDGGQSGSSFKNSLDEALNTITIHAGAKVYYLDYNPERTPKWTYLESTDNTSLIGDGYFVENFYPTFDDNSGIDHSQSEIIIESDTIGIPSNYAMIGVGSWFFNFRVNNRPATLRIDQPNEFSATLNLSVPKYAFNPKTDDCYKPGDTISLYNYHFVRNPAAPFWYHGISYTLVSKQVLSETSQINSDFFKLEPILVNNLNLLTIGSVVPVVMSYYDPEIKLAGDPTEPIWENYEPLSQSLYKSYMYDGLERKIFCSDFAYGINQKTYDSPNPVPRIFLLGKHKKDIRYHHTISDGVSYSNLEEKQLTEDINILMGNENPYNYVIEDNNLVRTTLNVTINCENAIIKPSIFIGVGALYGAEDTLISSPEIIRYVSEGFISSYALKVGQAYKFYITDPRNGKQYMRIDTVKSANTVIEINNAEVCDFIDSGGF